MRVLWRKYLAAAILLLSSLGLTFSLFGVGGVALAADSPHVPPATQNLGDVATGMVMEVPPYCNYYGSDPGEVQLIPQDSNGNDSFSMVRYGGVQINLKATSPLIYTYLGASPGRVTKGLSRACSWFGLPTLGAQVDVEIDGSKFIATAVNVGLDPAMDFSITPANSFRISRTFDPSCSDTHNAFDVSSTSSALNSDSLVDTNILTLAQPDVSTNNFCKWQSTYELYIPKELAPTINYGTYIWVGPKLIYTIVVPG